jgi:hypothetical protein
LECAVKAKARDRPCRGGKPFDKAAPSTDPDPSAARLRGRTTGNGDGKGAAGSLATVPTSRVDRTKRARCGALTGVTPASYQVRR